MSSARTSRPARRAAAALATVVVATTTALGAAGGGTSSAAAAPGVAPARPTTALTLDVPGCDGCSFVLTQARWDDTAPNGVRYWSSREKTVRDGAVTFTVPTRRTHGLSITVDAPWERRLPYVTQLVFRYRGERPGDVVGVREARHKRFASGCWTGTRQSDVTLPLTVRKIWTTDNRGDRTRGSIAYVTTSRHSMAPMRRAVRGVLGSQDVQVCGRHAAG